MNNMILADCLDFVVFFTVDFQWWCFVIQFIGLAVSKEVDVKTS